MAQRGHWVSKAMVALVVVVGAAGVPAAAVGAQGAPTLVVSPATGVLDRQPVTVTGSGLPPGTMFLRQCAGDVCSAPPSAPPYPSFPVNSEVVEVASDGTFSTTVRIDRQMTGAPSCLEVACTVRGTSVGDLETDYSSDPIQVAATGTYQWPQATLAVTTPALVDRGLATVQGSGYDPRSGSVYYRARGMAATEVCRAVADPGDADCVVAPSSFESFLDLGLIDTSSGTVSGRVRVVRHLALPSGRWDCARQGCTLALTQDGNPVSQRVPMTWAPEWAPTPSVDAFLDRVVAPVLGRPPTPAGRARLRAGLLDRSTTGVAAVREVAAASLRDADVGEVVRTYRTFFDREVDAAGLAFWVGRLREGMTPLRMARSFGGTPEFRARHAGLSDAEAVTLTYRSALGRSPSTSDLAYWTGRLEAGLSRADMAYSFARAPEQRARSRGAVQATIVLWVLTGAVPSAAQRAAGLDRVAADAIVASG